MTIMDLELHEVVQDKLINTPDIKIIAPSRGYHVPNGYSSDYRASAIAFLKRSDLQVIKNKDGNEYTLYQLERAASRYDTCKHVRREGESCRLNNKCTYPNCNLLDLD